MDTIIIAVDLGHFRAYRVKDELMGKGKIELLESYDTVEGREKLVEKVTDQAGRFKSGGKRDGVQKAKGYGEPHTMRQESERKLIRKIAGDITELLAREHDYDRWFFAAAEEIHNRILETIPADVKTKLEKDLVANLTSFKKLDVLQHFESA